MPRVCVLYCAAAVCACICATAAADATPTQDPRIALQDGFNWGLFTDPPATYWPAPFWLWNAPLEPELLRAQLRDMKDHGFRSVCMLPMPHAFRPDSTNNQLEPDYLTPAYFARTREAVDFAAELGMKWWMYDEGGWPSGQATGKVAEGHPEFVQQSLVRARVDASGPYVVPADAVALVAESPEHGVFRPGETWQPASPDAVAYCYRVARGGYVDLLNPAVTKRFIELTHDGYAASCGERLGNAIHFAFTDEPGAPNLHPPDSIPWTEGMESLYAARTGANLVDDLPWLFIPPGPGAPIETARARIRMYDCWTARFRDAYFMPLREWCRAHWVASGGHLNGEDETANAARYGFGQALRQLRAMDVPGVDAIWRQIFPGNPNLHHFPKYASSAAHQNGTRFAFTESFCVYGNGLTPAQMKWVTDYQFVRGLNLLVVGCFPLSARDHHMTGERPHFGAMDPLWDHLTGYNAYVARLSYLMSSGTPKVATALYYPARDLWALGLEATDAVNTHDALARALLERQCDFDLIDDDLLAESGPGPHGKTLIAGAMNYSTIVCGATRWMHPDALRRLEAFAAAGGKVICLGGTPGTDGAPGGEYSQFRYVDSAEAAARLISPTVVLVPESTRLRVAARQVSLPATFIPGSPAPRMAARRTQHGKLLMIFNEGDTPYSGQVTVPAECAFALYPETGRFATLLAKNGQQPVQLEPGASLVLLYAACLDCGYTSADGGPTPWYPDGPALAIDDAITATPRRRIVAGEHEFETQTPDTPPAPFVQAAVWRDWLSEDFSGEVDYVADVDIPEDWAWERVRLETGPIEYAATVFVDGEMAGQILWAPWTLDLDISEGHHKLVIRVANTLANELTSARVAEAWAAKQGPGWPSPYHERALVFERESRGGGLHGPVRLLKGRSREGWRGIRMPDHLLEESSGNTHDSEN